MKRKWTGTRSEARGFFSVRTGFVHTRTGFVRPYRQDCERSATTGQRRDDSVGLLIYVEIRLPNLNDTERDLNVKNYPNSLHPRLFHLADGSALEHFSY